jgi:hypothetical protein
MTHHPESWTLSDLALSKFLLSSARTPLNFCRRSPSLDDDLRASRGQVLLLELLGNGTAWTVLSLHCGPSYDSDVSEIHETFVLMPTMVG